MGTETFRAEDWSDEYLAQSAIDLAAEYDVIAEAHRVLAVELRIVWEENSQHGSDEMLTKFIDDLRVHAENCGTLSDRTRNATAKFVLAARSFELMQEAEVLEHFQQRNRRRLPGSRGRMVNPDDWKTRRAAK
jgi:hypothetical protein